MRARALALALAVALAGPACAEEGGLGGFFKHLFGGPPKPSAPTPPPKVEAAPEPRPVATPARPKPPHHKPAAVAAHDAAPASPPPTATQFVYVLGDSLAINAADGMAADLKDKPEIGVIDRARDSSGLVNQEFLDWSKAAQDLVAPREPAKDARKPGPEKPKVDYVVVMLGINDMQPLKDGDDFVDPLTDRWNAIYARRIQAVVAPLRAAHVPVLWVGLPPMRAEKTNAQALALNQLFKDNAEAAGAKYIDIFDAFADQNGGFDAYGPDLEGRKERLRGANGILFTAAGGLKLAHFLDVQVLAALRPEPAQKTDFATLPPDLGRAPDDVNEQIRREMGQPAPASASARPEAGAVASLAARPASPGAVLVTAKALSEGEAERRLRRGDPPPAAPGRADDFSR